MYSRRSVLTACAGASAAIAGCTTSIDEMGTENGSPDSATESPTDTCSATDPPRPTDAVADPRPYPDRPSELTSETLEPFLESYERAYLYNELVASNPEKYGRTNEIRVRVESVAVDSGSKHFTGTVSGQVQTDFIHREMPNETPQKPTESPQTPTETPLPIGQHPFETSYEVTERELQRTGITLECW